MNFLSRFRWWRRLRALGWDQLEKAEWPRDYQPGRDMDARTPEEEAEDHRRLHEAFMRANVIDREAYLDQVEKYTGKREWPFPIKEKPLTGISDERKS